MYLKESDFQETNNAGRIWPYLIASACSRTNSPPRSIWPLIRGVVYTSSFFVSSLLKQLHFIIVFFVVSTVPASADIEDSLPCKESDIRISNALQVKQVFASNDKDNDLLTIHFDIPSLVNGEQFQGINLTITDGDDEIQLSTPLSTWEVDGNLEAVMFVSQSIYEEYSLAAHYFGENGCPSLSVLKLKDNKKIKEYLSCIRDKSWLECNFSESVLENAFRK